jgi:hypothetical protein
MNRVHTDTSRRIHFSSRTKDDPLPHTENGGPPNQNTVPPGKPGVGPTSGPCKDPFAARFLALRLRGPKSESRPNH